MTIIDFEFTGLDNTFITDNEIIQVKFLDNESGKSVIKNFSSKKKSTAGAFICHQLPSFEGKPFSKKEFENAIKEINIYTGNTTNEFIGFGVSQDKQMLSKYGIDIEIADLQERLMLTDEYEVRMATEGRSLEVCYYIATGIVPDIKDHSGLKELCLIDMILHKTKHLTTRNILTVMPFGHCAGMPLKDYVVEYRRAADGYRYNNSDLLARSLQYEIIMKEHDWDDDDEI